MTIDLQAFEELSNDQKRVQFKTFSIEDKRKWLDYRRRKMQNQVRWRPETWPDSDQYNPKALSENIPAFEINFNGNITRAFGFEKILYMQLGRLVKGSWQPFERSSIRVKLTSTAINIPKWFVLSSGENVCITRTR